MAPNRKDFEVKNLPPGVDYTLSACKGEWAFLGGDEGVYIYKGYRIGLSLRQCFKSMFQIHNETINVWSHLAGSLFFVYLCFHVLGAPSLHATAGSGTDFNPLADDGIQCYSNSSHEVGRSAAELLVCSRLDVNTDDGAASGSLRRRKLAIPGWSALKRSLVSQANFVKESVEHEAAHLRHSLSDAISAVDRSLEGLTSDLSALGAASLEGCNTCWSELLDKLSGSRRAILAQADRLSRAVRSAVASNASHVHDAGAALDHSLNATAHAKWLHAASGEMHTIAASLNTAISAAREALSRASHHIEDDVRYELAALQALRDELFHPHLDEHHSHASHAHGTQEGEVADSQSNSANPSPAPTLARWPIVVFLLSAFYCMFSSAVYHLLGCYSRRLHDSLLLLDYSGISVVQAGSLTPTIYYGFLCEPTLRWTYIVAGVSICTASFCIGIISGIWPSPFWRLVRVTAYCTSACSALIPLVHLLVYEQAGNPAWAPCFAYFISMLACYGTGIIFYISRFPERYFPGRFDLYFSSHQLWHAFVFAAPLIHFFGVAGHFHWRSLNQCQ